MIENALPAGSGAATYKRTSRLSDTTSGTNLKRAGNYNLRTVLKAVRLTPGTTRTTIAQQTGLAGPTIAKITNRLIDMDLMHISSRQQGGRGQPALQFEVNANGAFGIGLNIDRDHLTLVLLDLTGAVRSRLRREIPFALPLDVINFLRDELDHLIDHGGVDRSRILGLGIAIPDDIGRIRLPHRPPEYDHWNEINIATLLAVEWPWSIHCDNDAATAAFGEAEYGTAFGNRNFFYMLISAGLGGGLVMDRSYHRGATARSGEIGLMPDYSAGPGAIVQDTVSVSALLNRVKAAGHMTPTIDDLLAAGGPISVIVDHWLEDAVRSLVQPLTAINCLINPDAILIGGRLPLPLIERLVTLLTTALNTAALPAHAKIMPAVMAEDAPAVGAAILPFLDDLLPSDSILIQGGR